MIDEEPTVKTEEKSDNQLSGMAVESSTSAPPSPMIHSSKIELVRLLKDWITSHPNIRIPALARYDKNSLENSFAMEASLVGTNERIWIIRLGVIDMYQGWVLKKADGSIILVKAHYRKGGYVYYGWLGNDIGYSDEVIAHHKDVPRLVLTLRLYARKRNLDAEDVLNEYDISEDALEPENPTPKPTIPAAGRANKDGQESDTTLSSPPSDSDSSPVFSRASRKRPSGQDIAMKPKKSAKMTFSETSSPTPPISPCAIHNLTSIDDPQVRGKIKRLHKIFPTMTVAVCESVLYKNKGN
ncbi:MAG: hypothetical protein L6R42_011521, partial [Xanthoria sp. 1 TBL-2021]